MNDSTRIARTYEDEDAGKAPEAQPDEEVGIELLRHGAQRLAQHHQPRQERVQVEEALGRPELRSGGSNRPTVTAFQQRIMINEITGTGLHCPPADPQSRGSF
jgi:hypothetical protein